MAAESEDLEEKSAFAGSEKEWLELIKTIVAMANADGGVVVLRAVTCPESDLDSARLDDRVNRCVEPRVRGIESEKMDDGSWVVRVGRYQEQLHMFKSERHYTDTNGEQKSAWHPGQIYVRHSSKTEPATADDLRRSIRQAVANWMTRLGEGIKNLALNVSDESSALPVRLSDEAGALTIQADANNLYPYTAKTLGAALEKNQSWAAAAAARFRMKEDLRFAWGAIGASGEVVAWKYSEAALDHLKGVLRDDPNFDPYTRRDEV